MPRTPTASITTANAILRIPLRAATRGTPCRLLPGVDGRERRRDPAGLERVARVRSPAHEPQAELLAGAHERLCTADSSPTARRAPNRAGRPSRGEAHERSSRRSVTRVVWKKRRSRRRLAERPLDHLHRVRALQLEAVRLAAAVAPSAAPLVELDLDVEASRLGAVRHPVQRRRAAHEVERSSPSGKGSRPR